ncbi:MAG: zinc ribbon domain-containing protein [Anaerolineales bacterium]
MSLGAVFVGLALVLISGVVLADPYLRKNHHRSIQPRVSGDSLGTDRVEVLMALRDLDFDFQLGKISEEDYRTARMVLMREAAVVLQAQDRQDQALDAEIEAQVQSLRALKMEHPTCRRCNSPLKSGARFCSSCGSQAA